MEQRLTNSNAVLLVSRHGNDLRGSLGRWAESADVAEFAIDIGEARSKGDLLQKFASAFAFPSYFGQNWDGLLDLLRDLSWLDHANFLVAILNGGAYQASDPEEFRVLVEILAQAASDWRARGRSFTPVFVGGTMAVALKAVIGADAVAELD